MTPAMQDRRRRVSARSLVCEIPATKAARVFDARVLAILLLVEEQGGEVAVRDLPDLLGLPWTTAHAYLDLSVSAGFVRVDVRRDRRRRWVVMEPKGARMRMLRRGGPRGGGPHVDA